MLQLHKSDINVDGYLLVDKEVGGGYGVSNYNRLNQGMHLFRFVTKADAIKFAKKVAKLVGIKKVMFQAKLGKLAIKV